MLGIKVTIITVCFNSVKTLEKAIKSVIAQTHRNIEYIIIDGGSTDGSIDLIKTYERHINDWVSEPDRGLYDAMNKGIMRASGELIGLLNSDDWYVPDAVEKIVRYFEEHSVDVVHGNAVVAFDGSSNTYKIAPVGTFEDLYFHMIFNHASVFVKTEVYQRVGIFDIAYQISADYELMLRFFMAGAKFGYIPDTIAYYRMGGLSNDRKLWRYAVEEKNVALRNLEKIPGNLRKKVRALITENYIMAKKKAVFHFLEKRTRHQIGRDCLLKALESKHAFIIFGAGLSGVKICEWIRQNGFSVLYFVDNSAQKQGQSIGGLDIKNPDFLKTDTNKATVIIAVTYNEDDIERQLRQYQLRRHADYLFFNDLHVWMIDNYCKRFRL